MKQLTIAVIAFFLANLAFGQNIIDKHFEGYKQQEKFTTVHVSSKMFELAGYIELDEENNEEFEKLKEFIATIESFDMIAGSELADAQKKYNGAVTKVSSSHEELMSVDDKEGSFKFFIDEKGGIVNEVVMVGGTDSEFMVFSLIGKMNLKQLGQLAQMINQQGFNNHVNKMFEHGVDKVKVYPNPSNANSPLNIEVPSEMIGGTATLIGMNGTSTKTVDINGTSQEVQTTGLAPGMYVIKFEKDQVSIKKKVVIK